MTDFKHSTNYKYEFKILNHHFESNNLINFLINKIGYACVCVYVPHTILNMCINVNWIKYSNFLRSNKNTVRVRRVPPSVGARVDEGENMQKLPTFASKKYFYGLKRVKVYLPFLHGRGAPLEVRVERYYIKIRVPGIFFYFLRVPGVLFWKS